LRYGQIHRNTYINAPALLEPTLQLRTHPNILFAGQISGVEGYVESMATGLMAGINAARLAQNLPARTWPRQTANGSLAAYVSGANPDKYQPANITFDLLPMLPPAERARFKKDKKARRAYQCEVALIALEEFLAQDVAAAS
jgi:methylenetetrahydrofolate--tRNA-(uracil-5-)-methyltransferase